MKRSLKISLSVVAAALLAACAAPLPSSAELDKLTQDIMARSFRAQGQAKLDRLSPDEDNRLCAEADRTGVALDVKTAQAIEATASFESTATAEVVLPIIERARTFTGTRNDDWQPFSYVFSDGVERVLVPVGCFMMGSNNGVDNEQPVHEQCVTEPFWLDKYEVTNALYGSVGCSDWSSEADQPRNCVDWYDAQAFCEAQGGTLPSEMQWEYAARGVESWVYPWGNDYDAEPERVIGADDPTYGNTQTAPVGSRPAGASWVGVMDMSGNVWEWTHTRYDPYPYEEGDNGYNSGDISNRVLRGGSFLDPASDLRSAGRYYWGPSNDYDSIGFRCAFSLNSPDL